MRTVELPSASQSGARLNISVQKWYGAAIALLVLHGVVSFTFGHSYGLTIFGDVVQSVLIAFAAMATTTNTMRNQGVSRTFWMLLAAGCLLWLAAQLLWTLYEVGLRRDVPNPFVGDIVLFLHIVPFMAALALQPHIQKARRETMLGLIDLALLVLWWLYLYLLFVIPWQLVRVNVGAYGYNFNVLYLAENISFLAALGLVVLRSPPPWRRFYWHLFGAAVLYAAGSQLAGAAIDLGLYYTGSIYDLPLVASSAWLGCAALSAWSLQPQSVPVDPVHPRVPLWSGRVAGLAVLSIPSIACWLLVYSPSSDAVFEFRLILTMAALFLLSAIVFYKQHLLNRELVRLVTEAHDSLNNLLKLQNQLVQSEKLAALGQLVAGAAHEINNPLTAIIGYCELMSDRGPEQRAMAEKIGQQARRTKALVHDLLCFARESPADKKSTDINAIITSAIRLRQVQLVNHRVAVELKTSPTAPLIIADPNQMLQVVLHVVANAMDALAEVGGGVLKLSTHQMGDNVVLEVTDTGAGISEPNKVFDPFYTTKPIGQGTGLGLSMAYGIIHKHGGEISCWNNPGGGATFRIVLPTRARQEAPTAVV